ncbi:MAG: ABC transporter permease [Gemmatimonadaceae bacterium]
MSGPLNRTVMWLTWRQMFAKRRLWLSIAFSLAPLVFTLIFKLVADDGDESRVKFFTGLEREVVIGTVLALAAVIFGTTAFGGEIDDGTLVYLLVKPVPRWQIALSKLVVAVCASVAIAIPGIVLPWLVLSGPGVTPDMLFAFFVAAVVGALIYCSIFLSLGLMTRRSLVVGLVYVVLVEGMLARSLPGLRSLSVREFASVVATSLSPAVAPTPASVVTIGTVRVMGTLIAVAATAWAMWKVSRFELAERL